jgi:dTDP-4-amino-4,6-dideoxygalactose transaminase
VRIELGDWFISPIHPLLEKDWKLVKYQKGLCPIAEDVSNRIITLPIYRKITQKEIDKIISFMARIKK